MASIKLVQYGGMTPETTLSPPCGKVHMALRFKGLDYEVENVASPGAVKKYNRRGRMPALVIDGDVIVDSTDILTALDQRFPDPPLEPADPRDRALVRILEDWADEVLYFYALYIRWCVPETFARMKALAFGDFPAPLRVIVPILARRDVAGRARGQGVGVKGEAVVRRELSAQYRTLVDFLADRPFLVGDRMSRADIAVAANLDQHRVGAITPELADEIDALPAVPAWLDRVHALAPDAATG